MIDRYPKYPLPGTVDEAAEVLISDLTIQQMTAMAQMNDQEFDHLCVARLCFCRFFFFVVNTGNNDSTDPMRIIMDCLRSKLRMLNDVIITV